MKYPNINIPAKHRRICIGLLKEVNRKLDLMHRYSVNDFDKDVDRINSDLLAYIDGYTACMIYADAGFQMWFFSRVTSKITHAYKEEVKAMNARKTKRLDKVYNP